MRMKRSVNNNSNLLQKRTLPMMRFRGCLAIELIVIPVVVVESIDSSKTRLSNSIATREARESCNEDRTILHGNASPGSIVDSICLRMTDPPELLAYVFEKALIIEDTPREPVTSLSGDTITAPTRHLGSLDF